MWRGLINHRPLVDEGCAPRVVRLPQGIGPLRKDYQKRPLIAIPFILLTACATPAPVGIRTETVEVPVETQRPCPGVKPKRPAPLERPLPTNLEALAATLAAKLAEWSAPGMYGDKADAIMTRCLTEPAPQD